jgi:uncharacterized protein YbjT (DUF2867 family)
MQRVLITGAGGYLGRRLAASLLADAPARGARADAAGRRARALVLG